MKVLVGKQTKEEGPDDLLVLNRGQLFCSQFTTGLWAQFFHLPAFRLAKYWWSPHSAS